MLPHKKKHQIASPPDTGRSGERVRRADTGYALPEEEAPTRPGGRGVVPEVPEPSGLRRRRDVEAEDDGPSGTPTPRPRLALRAIPRLAMTEKQLRALPLDHKAGFVLAQIDGRTDLETLIDLATLDATEVCRVLERLLDLGAIVLT